MATIVHRRPIHLPAPTPRGPGASLSALTWVGWASLVVAAISFLATAGPVLEMGDVQDWDWGKVAGLAWQGLAGAAVLALPAALEWGVPGARRRTPWLLRGTVLLALEVLARAAVREAQSAVIMRADPTFGLLDDAFDPDSPAMLAFTVLRLGATVIGIAGVWALSDGLADAGGRIGRRVLVAAVVVGAVWATWYVPFPFTPGDMPGSVLARPTFWLSLIGAAVGIVDSALWFVVAARLVAGLRAGAQPRRAWAIGAVAGVVLVVGQVLVLVELLLLMIQPEWPGYLVYLVTAVLGDGKWILLALAFAAGLGRGRVRREERPRLMRLFIVDPVP